MNFFDDINKFVLSMTFLRFLSGIIEITAGILMLKLNSVPKALVVNSMLAIIGPIILITTTSIGILGMQSKLSFTNIFLIFFGVFLIIYGIRN